MIAVLDLPRSRDMAKKQAKRAGGRPKSDPATHKDKPISARFVETDLELVKKAAQAKGLKQSEFLREAAIEAARRTLGRDGGK